jgi:hypothetical protein
MFGFRCACYWRVVVALIVLQGKPVRLTADAKRLWIITRFTKYVQICPLGLIKIGVTMKLYGVYFKDREPMILKGETFKQVREYAEAKAGMSSTAIVEILGSIL